MAECVLPIARVYVCVCACVYVCVWCSVPICGHVKQPLMTLGPRAFLPHRCCARWLKSRIYHIGIHNWTSVICYECEYECECVCVQSRVQHFNHIRGAWRLLRRLGVACKWMAIYFCTNVFASVRGNWFAYIGPYEITNHISVGMCHCALNIQVSKYLFLNIGIYAAAS